MLQLRCPSPDCHFHSVPHSCEGIQSWTNVQVDGHRVVRLRLTAVVVDDVTYPSPTPIYNPVMSVKWKLITASKTSTDTCTHKLYMYIHILYTVHTHTHTCTHTHAHTHTHTHTHRSVHNWK